MKKLSVEIQEDIINNAEEILENVGLDVETAVKMFLKRIVREQSVAFILQNTNVVQDIPKSTVTVQNEVVKTYRGEMRKNLAVKMFRERGVCISRNITYSSKNRTTFNYWSNPDFSVLVEDWTFILNDWVNRRLYLFGIPGKAISEAQLVARNDKKELIDIQILDNQNFMDKRSGFSFRPFLVDEIEY